jgi:predicted metalloprotease with PDZ domain
LTKGDVILEFAGTRVWSVAQFRSLIRETPPGRTVNMQVSCAGQVRTVTTKLETAKPQHFNIRIPEIHIPQFEGRDFAYRFIPRGAMLGISADDLTSQLAAYFGVKQGKGVLVTEVMVGSAAEKAGLKAGDVIVGVDGKAVSSVAELRGALPHDFEGKKTVALTVVRDRREQSVTVGLEQAKPGELFRSVELEGIGITPRQIEQLRAEVATHKAGIERTAESVRREWTQEKRRYLQELQRSLQQWRQQLRRENEKVRDYPQSGKKTLAREVV